MSTILRLKKRIYFLNEFNILLVILFSLLLISFLGQYSAFNGQFNGVVEKHFFRIIISIFAMIILYFIDFKIWGNISYCLYFLIFMSLVIVELLGIIKLGAQRWVDLYFVTFQPSEIMKIVLILSISRYYSLISPLDLHRFKTHIIPIIMIIAPILLILKQPDLGTASVLFFVGFGMIFLAGFPMKFLIYLTISGFSLCPFLWFLLHDYQKNRIITFLNPDNDPLGIGYHVLQSKIAIGSGGFFGRGFLNGTQSKLNFLPEKNTDFIFTTIAEEKGFIATFFIIFLFLALTLYFFWIGSRIKKTFSQLMCYGFGLLLFIHFFVNIAMVIGVVPVVGIPLPFLSYGGSSMITFMISCGLLMAASINKRDFSY